MCWRIWRWEEVQRGRLFGVVFWVFDLEDDGRRFGIIIVIVRDV